MRATKIGVSREIRKREKAKSRERDERAQIVELREHGVRRERERTSK